jgi:NAD-reducing hydrogenase large subunit
VAKAKPELAMGGVALRRFGQRVIELMAKKRIHPGWIIPGGVTEPLDAAKRDEILAMIPEAYANVQYALNWYKQIAGNFQKEIDNFANFPSMFLGLVNEDESVEFTDGSLRLIDAAGNIVLDKVTADQFDTHFGEAVEPYSYMKFPFYKPLGYPGGSYRVGPLARLNIARTMGTPLADKELVEFKQLADGPVLGSFHYHHARLIDILYGIEMIERILDDKDTMDTHVRATAGVNRLEGAGVSEAPRGTLMHHYKVDQDGKMEWANLVIATGQNNNAMNRGVLYAAQRFMKGAKLNEGMLNRVEAVIRTFDPCLSCSTHAFGQMPLSIELVAPSGDVLDEIHRG